MLNYLHRAWVRHILYRSRIPYPLWRDCVTRLPVLARLNPQEQHKLRQLTTLFLHDKTIKGAGEFVVDDAIRVTIGAQACLLILNLSLDLFKGWHEVIVYADSFIVTREERDEIGLVHDTQRTLGGEAWLHGPVILSWSDAKPGARTHRQVSNVILHEFAHKLDMLNGSANGMPPLHPSMRREDWTALLSQAFSRLNQQIDRHEETVVDPYAAENPAEFFAVFTEHFFEDPARLHQKFPDVYEQLCLYYRQNPLPM